MIDDAPDMRPEPMPVTWGQVRSALSGLDEHTPLYVHLEVGLLTPVVLVSVSDDRVVLST